MDREADAQLATTSTRQLVHSPRYGRTARMVLLQEAIKPCVDVYMGLDAQV